jgi:outer membrane protein
MKSIVLQRLFTACAIVVLGGGAGAAWAQEALKIGYVNSERVLRESAPAKAAQAKLETEFGKRERELNDGAKRLKDTADRLDKDGPTLSESERTKRQRELVELERDLGRRRREFQEDLAQRRNEELASIVERANRVIRQIAEAEKYDLIVQEVIFASPRLDITEKVIRGLQNAAALGAPTPGAAPGR